MKNKSQTYNVILNSLVGIISSFIQIILNYIVRIVIVRELGAEINGIHNLFQNLINVMMLIETGFSTALIVHLYKPIEEKDETLTIQILQFYKKIYYIMAAVFFLASCLISLFVLDELIVSSIPSNIVKIFFILFVLSFVGNFLTCYKKGILYAEQKNRISIFATMISEIVFRVAQIYVAIKWHNYFVLLILMIFEKLCANAICNIYINKNHKYLKERKVGKINPELKKSIFDMVKPLFIFNLTSTVQQSAKSIYIGMFMGNVSAVGYIGNYQLVTSAVQMFCGYFGGAYTSSFGNISIDRDIKRMYYVYSKFAFTLNWLSIFMGATIIVCIKDFIMMTFGKEYVLSLLIVVLLVIDMLIYLFNIPIVSIQNALGLHDKDQKYMEIQAVIALSLGYFGGKYFGIYGILIGLILPQIIFTLINKGIIVYREVFNKPGLDFIKYLLMESLKTLIVVIVDYVICSYIQMNNYLLNFICKGFTSVIVCVICFVIISYKNIFFREYLNIIQRKR